MFELFSPANIRIVCRLTDPVPSTSGLSELTTLKPSESLPETYLIKVKIPFLLILKSLYSWEYLNRIFLKDVVEPD